MVAEVPGPALGRVEAVVEADVKVMSLVPHGGQERVDGGGETAVAVPDVAGHGLGRGARLGAGPGNPGDDGRICPWGQAAAGEDALLAPAQSHDEVDGVLDQIGRASC